MKQAFVENEKCAFLADVDKNLIIRIRIAETVHIGRNISDILAICHYKLEHETSYSRKCHCWTIIFHRKVIEIFFCLVTLIKTTPFGYSKMPLVKTKMSWNLFPPHTPIIIRKKTAISNQLTPQKNIQSKNANHF